MKHGVVKVSEEGVATFEENAGVVGYLTDAASTLISTTSAPVGYAALVQKVGLVLVGNLAGIHSATGRMGFGVAGSNIFLGK